MTCPMGKYDVTVTITGYEQDRFITWEVSGEGFPSIGHYYGYRLEPVDGGTLVTSIYDWSGVDEKWKPEGHLADHPRVRPEGHARHPRANRRAALVGEPPPTRHGRTVRTRHQLAVTFTVAATDGTPAPLTMKSM